MTQYEGEKLAGVPVARNVPLWLGDRTEEPTQVEPIGPDWNVNLISAEKGYGGTDAVDRRTVGEVAFDVKAEPFLGSAADGDDDVPGLNAIDVIQ